MELPTRIGGMKSAEKKPGMVIAVEVEKKIPPRIGGPREDDGEEESTPMESIQSKDDATREILSAVESKSESRLKSALEAFVYACGESKDEGDSAEMPNGAEE